ncbi:hypothetical protein O9Z70_11265 [Devosia sp. YIM 151766]|uniref:hypothetical protein n=1 Tax=Devosia sp. YIM 151766 TaxID=3017325 RepID=UPI00255CCB65|nr:hypothetical protein [Devosia sp. YIM 151766]WIY52057.1 hypothetical protein O9Z70_11265 [Devosia sp. YIM 151766]
MTEHHSSRLAREKKDSDRQQAHRDDLKASGTPTTHVLNRALVEGLMCQIDLHRKRDVDLKDMKVSVQNIVAYATSILTAGTNASDHYDVESVVGTIRKRIGQPKPGKFRLEYIPQRLRNADALKAIDYAHDLDD